MALCRDGSRPFLAALAVLVVGTWSGPADAAEGREVFRAHASGSTKLTTPSGTIPFTSGNGGGSFDFAFSPAETRASRPRPGVWQVTLAEPIVAKVTATVNIPLPGDDKETFSGTVNLSTSHATECKAAPVTASGRKGGTTVSLSTTVTCTDSRVYFYFLTYASPFVTRVSAEFRGDKGSVAYANAMATSVYEFLEDELDLTSVTPSGGTSLVPETRVTISATARVALESRASADVALRLYDQRDVLQASSDFVRITRPAAAADDGSQKAYSLAIRDFPVEREGPSEYRLRAVVIDPAGPKVVLQSEDVVYGLKARCSLEGAVARIVPRWNDEKKELYPYAYWMPDALVDLVEGTTPVVPPVTVKAQRDPENTATESFYCIQLPSTFDYSKQYSLRVRLQDNEKLEAGKLSIRPGRNENAPPVSIVGKPFKMYKGARNKQHLLVDGAGLGLSGNDARIAEAGAETWWHAWRQLNRMTPHLPDGFQVVLPGYPLTFFLDPGGKPPSYYCDSGSDVCPTRTSIVLSGGAGMPGARPTTLWHEFGHYLLHRLYESNGPVPPDENRPGFGHGGYYNAFTNDSIDEGFATFWGVFSNNILEKVPKENAPDYYWNDPKPNPSGKGFSIEGNGAAWDFRRTTESAPCPNPMAAEDLAFAGLLWDLWDTNDDPEPSGDVRFTGNGAERQPHDTVTWDAKSLTTLLGTSRPGTILRFREALLGKLPAELTSVAGNPRGSGLSQLDEIFVAHRFFHDASPADWRFQLGETVGRAANGLPWYGCLAARPDPVAARPGREERPQVPGSFLDLRFLTAAGQAVDGGVVDVEERFGLGLEGRDRTSRLSLVDGKVYFPMPPPQYPVTVSMSVPGSGKPPVVFDNAFYEANVRKGETFLSAGFVVPAPTPFTTSVVPQAAPPGSQVTIHGKYFESPAGLNAVTFDGTPASARSATKTELVVTVPAALGEGSAPIVVTTAAGKSLPLDFTVVTPVLGLSPSTYDFGTVFAEGSREGTLVVRNAGLSELKVLGATCTDPAFVLTSPKMPFPVEPGASREVKVTFRPPRQGSFGGTLSVATNDPVARVRSVTLSGAGDSQLSGPALAADPAAINLGPVAVGKVRNFETWLENAGSADVTVTALASSTPALTVTPFSALPAIVKPYGSLLLKLVFTPATPGPFAATITATSTDARQPTLTIPVRGEAVASTASTCVWGATPASLQLGPGEGTSWIDVSATGSCAWTATAGGFVTITSSATGAGNGRVSFRVTENPGPSSRSATLTIQGLAVRIDQGAPATSNTSFVPIVLSSAGVAGSFYTTELTLTNRGTSDALLDLSYTPFQGGGSGSGNDVLPAGAQLVFPDGLAYLRSLGIPIPESGNRGGTVRVRATGISSSTAFAATARTTTSVPLGRAGLSYAAVVRGLAETVYLCGLRQDAVDRSNVALMNMGGPGDGNVTLRLTAFSGDPGAAQSKVLPAVGLPPGGFAQISQVLASNGLAMRNGYVKVERIAGSAPFYAYAVVNDQVNSDGSFVPPVVASSLTGKAGLTLPVVVETGTYSTEVVLTNFGTSQKTARLTYVATAVDAAGDAVSLDIPLAAGEQKVIPGFVQALRDRHLPGVGPAGPTFAGAVFLSVPGGDVSGLAVGGRTGSPGGGGRFGLYYTGVPNGSAAISAAWVHGLQQDAENRSNLAIVNTGEVDGSGSSYRVELFDGATRALVKAIDGVSVPARGFAQLSSILERYSPGTSSAFARVTRVSGNNPFICYGVVNDGGSPGQRSDDGAFVPMDTSDEAARQPSLSVTPAGLDFGSVAVGQTADRSLSVGNAGTAPLEVSTLTATGPGFGLVSSPAPVSVVPGGTVPLTIRFAPSAAGAASGTLAIASNDPGRPSAVVPLSGSGTAASAPVLEVTPASLDFGNVSVGSSRDLPLAFRNAGGTPLVVSTAFVAHPALTVTLAALPFTVAPGAQVSVPVRFTPLGAGVVSVSLTVGSSDPARPTVYVPLRGEGVAPATVSRELAVDDGMIDSGFLAPDYFIVNRLTPSRYPATLRAIRLYLTQYTDLPSPAGAQVRVVAFTGTSGGIPVPGGAFAVDRTVALPAVPSGGAGWIDLLLTDGPVIASGDFYVGFRGPTGTTGVAFPADTSSSPRMRGYVSGDGGTSWGRLILVDRSTGAESEVNVMIRALVTEPAP